jgi:hypothetical protein
MNGSSFKTRNSSRRRVMRVNSSSIGTAYTNNESSTRSLPVQPLARQTENFYQGAPAKLGANTGAAMRKAETDIGANLVASRLRGKASFSSQDFLSSVDGIKRRAVRKPSTGTTLQVIGDTAFRQRVAADLAKFAPGTTVDSNGYVRAAATRVAGHDQGYELINLLLNNKNKVTIQFTPDNAFTQSGQGATGTPTRPGRGSTATVAYDPDLNISLPTLQADGTIRDEGIASEVVLAHELVHATHAQRGTIDRSLRDHFFTDGTRRFKETWRFEEFRTTGFSGFRVGNEPTENSIRAELGYRLRASYLDRSSWVPA